MHGLGIMFVSNSLGTNVWFLQLWLWFRNELIEYAEITLTFCWYDVGVVLMVCSIRLKKWVYIFG